MSQQLLINKQRKRRTGRVRRRIREGSSRARLTVFRSGKHVSAQVIDDVAGRTLAAASTQQKEVASGLKSTASVEAAKAIGKLIAERALAAGVTEVTFDRGHFRYHGRVAALAGAAREAGLKF